MVSLNIDIEFWLSLWLMTAIKFNTGIYYSAIPPNTHFSPQCLQSLIARFMGPIWGWQDPGGPHAGPMNLAIWGTLPIVLSEFRVSSFIHSKSNMLGSCYNKTHFTMDRTYFIDTDLISAAFELKVFSLSKFPSTEDGLCAKNKCHPSFLSFKFINIAWQHQMCREANRF